MSHALVFMMGQYTAHFPTDRKYSKNHLWAQRTAPDAALWRFGFGAYAVRLLQDVYFLDWTVEAPCHLKAGEEIGAVESKKAESSLYAPITGRLDQLNEQVIADPSAINVDTYDRGWLFTMEGEGGQLLSAPAYLEHLQSVWEVTQKTIKGQCNQ